MFLNPRQAMAAKCPKCLNNLLPPVVIAALGKMASSLSISLAFVVMPGAYEP